jgi:hypothetical protein
MTGCAFVYDLVEKYHEDQGWVGPFAKWVAAPITAVVFGWLTAQRLRNEKPMVAWSFLVLTWSAVFVSYLKSLRSFLPFGSHTIVELIFTLSAVAVTWLVLSKKNRSAPGCDNVCSPSPSS